MHLSSSRMPSPTKRRGTAGAGQGGYRQRLAGARTRRAGVLIGIAVVGVATPVAVAASAPGGGRGYDPIAKAAGTQTGPIRGEIHNPAYSRYQSTTGIFAKNPTWTMRLENVGHGGTATFGCHSSAGYLGCIEANNATGGLAFVFASAGNTGGEIKLANANGAPFTTNAHGVASGLNANYLQGKQASEFQLANQPAANSNELGGQPASSYVSTAQLLFADVAPGPKIENGREATAVTSSGTEYRVTFGTRDVSRCSYTASPTGAALTSGQLGVEPDSTNKSIVVVKGPSGFGGGFDLQVVC